MDQLFWLRLSVVSIGIGCGFVIVRRHARVVAILREFFFRPSIPESLALLRIYLFAVLLYNAWKSPAEWFASLHPSFQTLPRGWPWLKVPLDAACAHMTFVVRGELLTTALAMIGLFTRPAAVLSTMFGVLVFGVPCFYFKIGHGMQIPLMCAMVVALAPCGDALSVDSFWRRRRGGLPLAKSVAYTIPVRFSWLLVGTMYLFPGVWKLWEAGDMWMNGTELRIIMFRKWSELPDYYPFLRIDRSQFLLGLFGTGTLILETSFFFAVFHPLARVIAALGAACFHVGIGLTMDIWFDPTTPLLVLIDVPDILTRRFTRPVVARVPPLARWVESRIATSKGAPAHAPALAKTADSGAAPFLVGGILVLLQFWSGLIPLESFPVGAYPLFANRGIEPRKTGDHFEFYLKRHDGIAQHLRSTWVPIEDTSAIYRLIHKTLDLQDRPGAFKRHLELISRIVQENNPGVDTRGALLQVYHFEFPADPDEKRKAQGKEHLRQLVAEIEL